VPLGAFIPGVDAYLLPVIALVVAVSLVPLVMEVLSERRRSDARV
jgi:membrane-associated protein